MAVDTDKLRDTIKAALLDAAITGEGFLAVRPDGSLRRIEPQHVTVKDAARAKVVEVKL